MPEIHDYSTPGNKDTVKRIVRPHCHVGHSYGGDRVKLDASELDHPAMVAALWTDADKAEHERKLDDARKTQYAGPDNAISRAADVALEAAVKDRRRAQEAARTDPAAKG